MIPAPPPDSFPIVYHGGQFRPAAEATVSIFDRGLLYGDGLFETLRVRDARPLRWQPHFERLERGADFLRITPPQSTEQLHVAALRLIELNQAPTAMLRLTLTRGVGPRGYSSAQAQHPTLLMTLHPAPPVDANTPRQWRLVTSRIRIPPDDPLTRFKTCNRLPYVLARQDAEIAQVDDALMLNTRDQIAETAAANVFWLRHGCLGTTPVDSGALPGITRATVLRLARDLGLATQESAAVPADLFRADAVFLTVTSLGIIEVVELDRRPLARSPMVPRLHAAYWGWPEVAPD
jgi:branched-chain amino acid aminotransferase